MDTDSTHCSINVYVNVCPRLFWTSGLPPPPNGVEAYSPPSLAKISSYGHVVSYYLVDSGGRAHLWNRGWEELKKYRSAYFKRTMAFFSTKYSVEVGYFHREMNSQLWIDYTTYCLHSTFWYRSYLEKGWEWLCFTSRVRHKLLFKCPKPEHWWKDSGSPFEKQQGCASVADKFGNDGKRPAASNSTCRPSGHISATAARPLPDRIEPLEDMEGVGCKAVARNFGHGGWGLKSPRERGAHAHVHLKGNVNISVLNSRYLWF